jgi:hypothetical protein
VYILHTSLLSGTGESRWIVLVDFAFCFLYQSSQLLKTDLLTV